MIKPIGRVLAVWGGWDGHEPQQVTEYVAGLAREIGLKVDISSTLGAYTDPRLKEGYYDAIYQSWTNEPGPQG